ncbi:hypothetical protein VDG1235_4502 [Verrucomicrobiia bacterium DG1235]|nr:hypothetical protein VDG1235_4502 [Verrucomicrobiae bacterium DG1235]
MISYLSFRPVVLFLSLVCFAAGLHAKSSLQKERVVAAFILETGQAPRAEELTVWLGKAEVSLAAAMAEIRGELAENDAIRAEIYGRAYRDAFGLDSKKNVNKADGSIGYTELMRQNLALLIEDGEAYAEVIGRAYEFVIGREPYEEEIAYWSERNTLSYVLLVGCVEDWARRNQPGLMVTSGTPTVSVNCGYLENTRLSPSVAAEVRAVVGLDESDEPNRHVIAVGADELLSMGGVHFLAVGGTSRE